MHNEAGSYACLPSYRPGYLCRQCKGSRRWMQRVLRPVLSRDDGPSARAQGQITSRPSRCSPTREIRRETCRCFLPASPRDAGSAAPKRPPLALRRRPALHLTLKNIPAPLLLPHTPLIPPRTKGSISRRPASRAGCRSGTRTVTRGATIRGSPHPPGESPGAGFR
jgi:hypothetical protein